MSDGPVDETTRYSDDREAKRFVRTFPDGASRDDVGVAFGWSKENVRLIEQRALKKLVDRLALVGITRDDIASILATRRGRYEDGVIEDGHTAKYDNEGPRGAMDRCSSERIGSGPQSPSVLRLFSILAASRRHAKRANAIAERLGYTKRDA